MESNQKNNQEFHLDNEMIDGVNNESSSFEKEQLKINNSFIVNALRNCGYNNYSAISDIIDNSVEPDVESSFVKVDFETEGKGKETKIVGIYVIDDGCGMSEEILREAVTLGSNTGKNGELNLGMYGAGLKTASFSIGQKIEVFSKENDGNLNYAIISLENTIQNNEDIFVGYKSYNKSSNEYKWFIEKVGKQHGTIVKISSIDRLSNKDYNSFKGTLKTKIAENFNKFIYNKVLKFFVCNDEVPYVDLMGNSITNDLMGDGEFTIDGHTISYKAWYMTKNGDNDSEFEENNHISNGKESYTRRDNTHQGLYIYRQNRLVGKALTLGLFVKDHWKNGFRCEVFIDGNCDYLFESTFTKMISERTSDCMSQALIDKLRTELSPFWKEATRRDKQYNKEQEENDPVLKKEMEEFYRKVTEKQNKNMLLKADRKGVNKPKTEDEKEHKERGPQKNPSPTKIRTNKWIDGFEEVTLGRGAEMYLMERTNNKRIMLINKDHEFYKQIYSKLDADLKFLVALYISCEELAKQNVNYANSPEVQHIIDEYNSSFSWEVNKSLS